MAKHSQPPHGGDDPQAATARFTENPFHVLGLRPDCTRKELEREGQKLLHMLQLGLKSVRSYPSPLGPKPRTEDAVRQAMAELRDPKRRVAHELWATLPPRTEAEAAAAKDNTAARDDASAQAPRRGPSPWPEAFALFGWRRR